MDECLQVYRGEKFPTRQVYWIPTPTSVHLPRRVHRLLRAGEDVPCPEDYIKHPPAEILHQ